MNSYIKLFNTSKFIGSQPITFNKDTYDTSIKYFLTHKLNGERKLLLLSNNKAYLVNTKKEFKEFKISSFPEILNNTVLDCEYYKNKLYIFDILYFSGNDVRNFNLDKRIDIINKVHKLLHFKKIKIKKYLSNNICTDFFNLYKKHLNNMKKDIIDGIIFTPNLPYTTGISLKWKPTFLLSIDFKIKKLQNNIIALLTQKNTVFSIKGKKNIGYVKVIPEQYNKYNNNEVIEFIFKNGKFIPIKERKDKITSNHISVILSNFKTINNPPNMNKILCK